MGSDALWLIVILLLIVAFQVGHIGKKVQAIYDILKYRGQR